MKTTNIMLVGVGGQDISLAAQILSSALTATGCDVKVSAANGASQLGGSVSVHVKFGEKVYSPVIGLGEADVIVAFELLEAYRALPYLRAGGKMLIDAQQINPMPVAAGAAEYPQAIVDKVGEQADVKAISALMLAKILGSAEAVGAVMMGLLARSMDIPREKWVEAIEASVPEKLLSVNLSAFDMGFNQL